MKAWIEDLLSLQETDLRLRRIKLRLEMLPVEKEKVKKDLEEDRKNLHDAKESSLRYDMDIKQVESSIEQVNAEIDKLQSQSVMVKKNDEYKALMNEIAHCKKKISDFETEEIVLFDKVEEAKESFNKQTKSFTLREKNLNEELKELDELADEFKSQIEKMTAERQKKAEKIEPRALTPYNRLINKGRGKPFVSVSNGTCGNCHMKLTPQTINESRKANQVNCDICGHMIYFPD